MPYAAQKAFDAAAHYFTGELDFFALKPEQSRYGGPPETETPGLGG